MRGHEAPISGGVNCALLAEEGTNRPDERGSLNAPYMEGHERLLDCNLFQECFKFLQDRLKAIPESRL
ncbi:hypothetical protein BH10ACI4_BH10ACI4_25150 [soil metagenome]